MNLEKLIGLHHKNIDSKINFKNNNDVRKKEQSENSRKNLLYTSMVSLGILGVGYFLFSQKLTKQNKKNSVEEILKSLPIDKTGNSIKIDYQSPMYEEILGHITNEEDLKKFKLFLSLLKNNYFNNIKCPKIIATNLDESSIKKLSNVFMNDCKQNIINLKYKNSPEKFLKSLDIISDNIESPSKYLGVYIENYISFVRDLENVQNKNLKNNFENLLKKIQDKNIVYWIKKDVETSEEEFDKIYLNFDNQVDINIIEKIYKDSQLKKKLDLNDIVQSRLTELVGNHKTLEQINSLDSLYAKDSVKMDFFIVDKDVAKVNDFLQHVTSDTNNILKEIDTTKSESEIIRQLTAIVKLAEEDYNLKDKKTILKYSDIKLINKSNEIKEKIKDLQNKDYIISVISLTDIKNCPSNMNIEYYTHFIDQAIGNPDEILNNMLDKTYKNPFKHVENNGEKIKSLLLKPLAYEKAGLSFYDIPNGILFYGQNEENISSTIDAFKNYNTVNYKKIQYLSNDPLKVLKELVEHAQNAEEDFKKTNCRTIIEIKNLDEMLTQKTSKEDILMIGRFKGLVERLSKEYHTTIVMGTIKPLEHFEPATIAPHRFGVQIKVD